MPKRFFNRNHKSNQDRNLPKNTFYQTKQWQQLRRLQLSTNPMCNTKGCTRLATDVHHKKDIRYYPELKADLDNLESLCHSCHSKETKKRMN